MEKRDRFVFWGKEQAISDLETAQQLEETLALALRLEQKHPLWQIEISFALPHIFIVEFEDEEKVVRRNFFPVLIKVPVIDILEQKGSVLPEEIAGAIANKQIKIVLWMCQNIVMLMKVFAPSFVAVHDENQEEFAKQDLATITPQDIERLFAEVGVQIEWQIPDERTRNDLFRTLIEDILTPPEE